MQEPKQEQGSYVRWFNLELGSKKKKVIHVLKNIIRSWRVLNLNVKSLDLLSTEINK